LFLPWRGGQENGVFPRTEEFWGARSFESELGLNRDEWEKICVAVTGAG